MDLLTLLGLLVGITTIVAAIATSSGLASFLNIPGFLIVVVGTLAVTLIKHRMTSVVSAFRMAFGEAFRDRTEEPLDLILQIRDLADIVRKKGILGLEDYDTRYRFLARSIDYDTRYRFLARSIEAGRGRSSAGIHRGGHDP